jgi:hypothetical protein
MFKSYLYRSLLGAMLLVVTILGCKKDKELPDIRKSINQNFKTYD